MHLPLSLTLVQDSLPPPLRCCWAPGCRPCGRTPPLPRCPRPNPALPGTPPCPTCQAGGPSSTVFLDDALLIEKYLVRGMTRRGSRPLASACSSCYKRCTALVTREQAGPASVRTGPLESGCKACAVHVGAALHLHPPRRTSTRAATGSTMKSSAPADPSACTSMPTGAAQGRRRAGRRLGWGGAGGAGAGAAA